MLPNNTPYLIAETAFHHEGDVGFLRELIDVSSKSNADAVKFHLLFDLDDYIIEAHPGHEALKKYLIDKAKWSDLFDWASKQGLDIITLVNDVASINWINKYHKDKVTAVEIHATGLNDIFLLNGCSEFNGSVILGIGGSTFDEIKYAVDFLKSRGKEDVFLMHGFQNYPTKFEDINLKRMSFLSEAFNLPVGYADHTDPVLPENKVISVLGVANGFNVVEKHITHKEGEKRIDHQSAIGPSTFKEIKELMEKIMLSLGNENFQLSPAELNYGETGPMKKAIVPRRKIVKGEKIEAEDLAFKRTLESSSLRQLSFNTIVGSVALKDISQDEIIDYSNVSFTFQKQDFSQFNVK